MSRCWPTVILLLALCAPPLAAGDKLDLNHATEEQLMALGLSPSQAMQVISHREKSGPFLQVEELLAVPQMRKDTFEKLRERVTVDE